MKLEFHFKLCPLSKEKLREIRNEKLNDEREWRSEAVLFFR